MIDNDRTCVIQPECGTGVVLCLLSCFCEGATA
jgi:hypothetical protein